MDSSTPASPNLAGLSPKQARVTPDRLAGSPLTAVNAAPAVDKRTDAVGVPGQSQPVIWTACLDTCG